MHKRAAFFGKLTVLPLFLFVLFFAFALSSCGKKSTGKIQGREIRLGIDRDNAPFSYLDEEKNPAGFDVELIEAIARLEGFTVKFVPMNPSALQSAVVTGTIVGAMGGIEIREEKQLSFSEAYGSSTLGLLYGDQSSASEQMPSLQGEEHLGKGGHADTATFLESIRQRRVFLCWWCRKIRILFGNGWQETGILLRRIFRFWRL